MYIGQFENSVIMFKYKHCYCDRPDEKLFQYKGEIQLDCTYEQALLNKDILLKAYPLLRTETLNAGDTIQETLI